MARSVPALVEPSLLAWARRTAGATVAQAAKAAGVTPERVEAWEKGESAPSLAKVRKLAAWYKRPLAVMFLPEPPSDFTPLRDFRRHSHAEPPSASMVLTLAVRRSELRRRTARELWPEVEGQLPHFTLSCELDEDPETAAARLRDWLKVTHELQRQWSSDPGKSYKGWRAAVEARGVLVFQASGVSLEEMRGFSIAKFPLPAITVNAADIPQARTFTMLHEMTHLALHTSGLCHLDEDEDLPPAERRVEVFCNAVAGAALLPQEPFSQEPELRERRTLKDWPDAVLVELGNRYGASRVAVLRRLLTLGRTTAEFYRVRTAAWQAEWAKTPQKKPNIPVKYHVRVVNANGPRYTRLVLNGYHQRAITLSAASDYLNLKLSHLDALEQFVLRPRKPRRSA